LYKITKSINKVKFGKNRNVRIVVVIIFNYLCPCK